MLWYRDLLYSSLAVRSCKYRGDWNKHSFGPMQHLYPCFIFMRILHTYFQHFKGHWTNHMITSNILANQYLLSKPVLFLSIKVCESIPCGRCQSMCICLVWERQS